MKYLPKIENIWMLLAIGEYGEGLVIDPDTQMPAIASDPDRRDILVKVATRVASQMQKTVQLVRFSERVPERVFEPPQPAWQTDVIAVPPTMTGPHGRAWRIDLAALSPEKRCAGVDAWLIEAPAAHPLWHSYMLICVHLRHGQNVPPPIFHLVDATHELLLFALDPQQKRQLTIEQHAVSHWLTPANFVAQFIEVTDDLARDRIEDTARKIVDGELNPDTDFRSQWIKLFGDNCYRDRAS